MKKGFLPKFDSSGQEGMPLVTVRTNNANGGFLRAGSCMGDPKVRTEPLTPMGRKKRNFIIWRQIIPFLYNTIMLAVIMTICTLLLKERKSKIENHLKRTFRNLSRQVSIFAKKKTSPIKCLTCPQSLDNS